MVKAEHDDEEWEWLFEKRDRDQDDHYDDDDEEWNHHDDDHMITMMTMTTMIEKILSRIVQIQRIFHVKYYLPQLVARKYEKTPSFRRKNGNACQFGNCSSFLNPHRQIWSKCNSITAYFIYRIPVRITSRFSLNGDAEKIHFPEVEMRSMQIGICPPLSFSCECLLNFVVVCWRQSPLYLCTNRHLCTGAKT